MFECAVCDDCGRIAVAGKEINGRLEFANSSFDPEIEYYMIKDKRDVDDESEEDDADTDEIGKEDYLLCSKCGAILHESLKNELPCSCGLSSYVKIRQAGKSRARGEGKCPSCNMGTIKTFYLGYNAATAVLGTALFEELPESEKLLKSKKNERTDKKKSLFGSNRKNTQVEIIRRMTEEIYDKEEYEKALAWTKAHAIEGFDKNPEDMQKTRKQKDDDWEFVVKMMVIIKDLMNGNPNLPKGAEEEMVGHNAIAAGFQGQRQWTDFYPNCDFPEALLNTSFDWNGAREPYILATENDVLNGLGMLFMKLLTGRAQMFADVRTYWSGDAVKRVTGYEIEGKVREADGFIHLINSGACCLDANGEARDKDGNRLMKKWWEVTEADQKAIMENTTWNYADMGYFRGGGFSSRFLTRGEMPMTMIRLNLVKGLGPVLQIAEGWSVDLPEEVSDKLWKRTDYTWPCTWFVPRVTGKGPFSSAYEVMNHWGANHGAISYGHIGADIITLCSILRIPVAMHNVPEEQIFRPASWNAFGMDPEGADYRACQAYGPLYKSIR